MNVELTFTGAGLIAGLIAAWRLFRRGKWHPPILDRDIREFISVDAQIEPEGEDDLDSREVKQILQDALREHCPEEQRRMAHNLGEVIQRAVAEQTRDLIEWRGAVDAKLQHSNGHDRDLHKRMDRLEDTMRQEINGLRNALVEWMRGNRREGP